MNKTQPAAMGFVEGLDPALQMTFLGAPQVRLNNHAIRFRTRKTLALLVYLALEPGPQPRDKLCSLLWPEAGEGQGRVSLRGAIAHLNRAIGSGYLSSHQQETLKLDAAKATDLDVQLLAEAFRQAGQQGHAHNLEATLEAAVRLYQGEFLEGFTLPDAPEFDDWVLAQRELIRQWLDTILERLAQLQFLSGKPQLALESALRRVRLEPLNETAHQQLIELHLKLGNRGAALEAYQSCKTILQTELGLVPSPQTEALLAQLGDTAKSVLPSTNEKEPVLPHQTRLVGREEALARIQEAWNQGQTIFISGEAGVGKTRLVQEFLTSQPGQTLYRSARPSETSVPYASLAETLRQLLQKIPNPHLEPWVRQELWRILPELSQGGQQSISREADKLRFFDAIGNVFEASLAQITTLVLDDLQFVDEASLEVLLYLNSKRADFGGTAKPNPIIGLFRPGEASATLVEEVAALLERDATTLIELKPLQTSNIAQLLTDFVPHSPDLEQLSISLHRFTGGNPLFVLETLRSLAQRGGLDALTAERFEARCRVAGLPRSPKVTAVIGRRLERLSPAAKDLSRIAAIMGEQFSLKRAAKVLETNTSTLAPVCEELEIAQVWRGLKFSHDLLYEATLEDIPLSLQTILHGQALDILEDSGVPASVLVRHAIAARREEASFKYSYQSGLEAFKLYALPKAVEHLERVRTMGNAVPELWKLLSEDQRYTLYHALLSCFQDHGLHLPERKEPIKTEMAEFGHGVKDVEVGQKIEISLAYEHFYKDWDSQPLEHVLGKRLEQAQQTGNDLQVCDALLELGDVFYTQDKYAKALGLFTEALEVSHKLADGSRIASCLLIISIQCFNLGEWNQAEILMTESLPYLTAKDRLTLNAVRVNRAFYWEHFGRSEAALAELWSVIAVWREYHDLFRTLVTHHRIAVGLLELGRYGEAHTHILETYQLKHANQPIVRIDLVSISKTLMHLKLGQLQDARITLEEFRPLRQTQIHLNCVKPSLATELHALEGNWPQACASAVQAFGARESLGFERHLHSPFMPRWFETEALLRGGREDLARESLRRLDEASQPYQRLRIAFLRSLAVLEAWENRIGQAIATLEQAKALALQLKLPGEIWEIEAKLAELLALQGEYQKAEQARASALSGIHQLADGIEDVEVKAGFLEFAKSRLVEVPVLKA